MATALSYNNNLLKFNNYVIDPSSTPVPPTPQEIIIPVLSTDEFGINYNINDIPLNTPLTFSYTDYSGNPANLPLSLVYIMYTSDWSDYYASPNFDLSDKVATFTITDKRNYTGFSIDIFKSNLSEQIDVGDMSGYKLSYTV